MRRGASRCARLLCPTVVALLLLVAPAARSLGGEVSGRVVYDGVPPSPSRVYMSADPVCERMHPEGVDAPALRVSADGGVSGALVYVTTGLEEKATYPLPPGPALLETRGCQFVPHVIGLRAGQVLEIRNADATFHGVLARPTANTGFHDGLASAGQVLRKRFDHPELPVKLKCEVHPWMTAYAGVFAHPFFATSNGTGEYRIAGLAPGTYTLSVWHETLGAASAEIKVPRDAPANLDFHFAGNRP